MKIRKAMLLAAVIGVTPLTSFAANDNIGTCGWGAKLFDGQSGVAPQVLAVTTNGTSGNQTFGISSGTSGCTQDGMVKSTWMTAMFIDGNRHQLARDMSVGSGETLDALAALIGVEAQDRTRFDNTVKNSYGLIYASEQATADQIVAALRDVLAQDAALARYSANI
ncbi:MAG: hypothetical protein FD165_1298 [Gammaproteobacteria bacterium]|nr:MAG: hypothetical protein FD165_1298 [Gammaproteobacteria bacterium]TND05797.1 MAG: hypothetical protein FD120_1010 [Gammaproteobacteria bacterium]